MQFRSLILLGLCAALGLSTPALAEVAKPQKSAVVTGKSKTSAETKSTAKGQKKKVASTKKKSGKQEAKQLTDKEKAKLKAERAEKARQDKLAALRAKAKADAEALRKAAREKAGKPVEVAQKEAPKAKKNGSQAFFFAGVETGPEPAVDVAPVAAVAAVPVTGMTAERVAAQEAARVGADVVVRSGNNGELRSGEAAGAGSGFFQILFGDEAQVSSAAMLPETRALDAVSQQKQAKRKFRLKPEYEMQMVQFSGYPSGTIVIDTANHYLYLVESGWKARRYGIAVGRDGLQYKGMVKVGDKQEWPRWIPTKEMQEREPAKYARYADGMPGGGENPLGARAIYLYQGKQDTHLRIHGTIAPQSIGTNSSNGCFRMVNEHVIDLYSRVRIGTPVVVL